MRRGEPKFEIHPEPTRRPNERPRLGRALAVCGLLGAAFVGCSAGPEWTVVHEAEPPLSPARRAELTKASHEVLGREALEKIGYARIIELARQAGFVTTQKVPRVSPAGKGALAMGGAVPVDEIREVFTKYAVAAAVTSQVDSPLPGPGDVAAVGLLVIGLLHVGGIVAEEILARTSPRPVTTTAPPPVPPLATATSTPTATPNTTGTSPPIASPTTTVVVPPIGVIRKRPEQTCDDARLRELEKKKAAACAIQWSCRDEVERIGKLDEKLLTCAEILARIAIGKTCRDARQLIQDECYGGSPDSGHQTAIDNANRGIKECERKLGFRGPGGGPCPR